MKNPGEHGLLGASTTLQLRPLTPAWCKPLAHMLRALVDSGEDRMFAPHPFDDETLARLASHGGADLYFVLTERGHGEDQDRADERVVGYGLLRGWDQGYEVPSLGIAVAPDARRRGVGRVLMQRLHEAARARGARRVRLRVHAENAPAIRLYESLGYVMDASPRENGLVVGVLELPAHDSSDADQ